MPAQPSRAERERERYNEGLQREHYYSVFLHTRHYYLLRRKELIKRALQYAEGRRVLELGSTSWRSWIEDQEITPAELHCINISEVELARGENVAKDCRNRPRFHMMDAHQLRFEDSSFDVVFGNAILHHLDMSKALDEVQRVLAPDGCVLFLEPLDMNPLGRLVRWATPKARTDDEKPFRLAELRHMRKRFRCKMHYEQFISVPAGLLSQMIWRRPANPLTFAAYHCDRALDAVLPPLRPMFRNVLIEGRPHTSNGSS